MTRRKSIDIDGAVFMIAPLTVEQVEDYLGRTVEDRATLMGKLLPVGMYDLVAAGLNNAAPAINGDGPVWNKDRIRKELDLISVERLFEEILIFSKMKLVKVEESPGEAMAAAQASPELSVNS
jgi:hypothetical protein